MDTTEKKYCTCDNTFPFIHTTLAALILSCCTPIKQVPLHTVMEHHTLLHDTIIKTYLVPYADSIETYDTCSFLSNPYGESKANIKQGRLLTHTLRTYPTEMKVKLSLPTVHTKLYEQKPLLIEKPLTKWQQLKLTFGGWTAALLGAALIFSLCFHLLKRKRK